MTTRQIRIALPAFGDMSDEQVVKLADDLRVAAHALRDYGPVRFWIDGEGVAQLVRFVP